MKTLIVFLAMLIVLSSFLIFIEDSSNYIKLQKNLKALAQECAAGGALFYDASSTKDKYVVDTKSANEYAKYILSESRVSINCLLPKNCSLSAVTTSFTNSSGNTCTKCVCTWIPQNSFRLFRLPFIKSPEKIEQSSVYEIKQ